MKFCLEPSFLQGVILLNFFMNCILGFLLLKLLRDIEVFKNDKK